MQQTKQPEYLKFAGFWLFMIIVTSWTSQGWLQPDEHARVLEPAHQIAYGFATLPWEIREKPSIVSFFLGVFLSPLLMITKLFGASGMTEAFFARLFTGLLASTRLIALLRIFNSIKLKPERHFRYLVVCSLAVFGPYIFVRTSQENYAATALLWAFALHFDVVSDHGKSQTKLILFSALLALATAARLQIGPAAAGLGLYVLSRTGPRIIPASAVGLILGLLPMAIIDYIHTGAPFSPAWNYLLYALGDEQGGHIWGTQPWWFYFNEFFTAWYPPISVLLMVPLLLGLKFAPSLFVVFIPFTLVHMLLGHKETRYFAPMIPFMQLSTFIGWEWLEENRPEIIAKIWAWPRTRKLLYCCFIAAGITGGLVPLNTSPEMYDRLGELLQTGEIDHYTYIGNTRSRPAQFFLKMPGMKPEGKLTLDDAMNGAQIPAKWIVIYATDPVFFERVSEGCEVKYVGLSPVERSLLKLLPLDTPIRRRINAIIYCDNPRVLDREL